jgi:hypothetical protein
MRWMSAASSVDRSAPVPAWRRVLPIAVGGALVTYVLTRLDLQAFSSAVRATDYVGFFVFTALFSVGLLLADTWATRAVYSRTLGKVGFAELFVVRAASYLPSILNHHVGQAWLTYFLARTRATPLLRVAGATLLVYATTFAALYLFLLLGVPLQAGRFPWLAPIAGAIAVLGALYLAVVVLRPAFLAGRAVAAPLFEAGLRGHALLIAYRIPHVAVQFVGAWVPFHFFGVRIPLEDALVLMPLLMFVVALPVSPQGLGTRDALSLALFSDYAVGSAEERAAAVAATTLSWLCALTLVQAGLSPLFMRRAYRLLGRGGTLPGPSP